MIARHVNTDARRALLFSDRELAFTRYNCIHERLYKEAEMKAQNHLARRASRHNAIKDEVLLRIPGK